MIILLDRIHTTIRQRAEKNTKNSPQRVDTTSHKEQTTLGTPVYKGQYRWQGFGESVLYGPFTAFSYLVPIAKHIIHLINCVRYNLNGKKDAFSILMWFVVRQLYFSYLEPKVSIKPSTDQQLCVFILPRWAMA